MAVRGPLRQLQATFLLVFSLTFFSFVLSSHSFFFSFIVSLHSNPSTLITFLKFPLFSYTYIRLINDFICSAAFRDTRLHSPITQSIHPASFLYITKPRIHMLDIYCPFFNSLRFTPFLPSFEFFYYTIYYKFICTIPLSKTMYDFMYEIL
jgi:hypothetical protein